jgi:hypothetical protein
MHYIALDSHKHYTLASVERPTGEQVCEGKIEHNRGSLRQFLQSVNLLWLNGDRSSNYSPLPVHADCSEKV